MMETQNEWPKNPVEYAEELKKRFKGHYPEHYPKIISFIDYFCTNYNFLEFKCLKIFKNILTYPDKTIAEDALEILGVMQNEKCDKVYFVSFFNEYETVASKVEWDKGKLKQYLDKILKNIPEVDKKNWNQIFYRAKNMVIEY